MLLSARSFVEYQAMFALSERDLRGRVLDCPGGAASFVAEAGARGMDAIAADPVYAGDRDTLGARALGEVERGLAFVEAHAWRFVWSWYGDVGTKLLSSPPGSGVGIRGALMLPSSTCNCSTPGTPLLRCPPAGSTAPCQGVP